MLAGTFHPHRSYLARAQDGLLTTTQLTDELGVHPDTLTRWAATGRVRRWHRGVYGDATLPETWRRWLMADLLRVGDDAVVGGRAAAALWGLAGFDDLEPRELLVPRPSLPSIAEVTLRGVSVLPEEDRTLLGPLRVTSVTATIASLPRFGVPGTLRCAGPSDASTSATPGAGPWRRSTGSPCSSATGSSASS